MIPEGPAQGHKKLGDITYDALEDLGRINDILDRVNLLCPVGLKKSDYQRMLENHRMWIEKTGEKVDRAP